MDDCWKKSLTGMVALCMLLLAGAGSSCRQSKEDQLVEHLDSFCTGYFNWRFQQAMPYCTDSSQQWLRYVASQVNASDIELLRAQEQGASFTMGDIRYNDQGDSAVVEISVNNLLQMDTLGKAARPVAEARYRIPLVKQQGQWKVTLSGVPRPL